MTTVGHNWTMSSGFPRRASALFRLGKMYFSKEGFTKRVYCWITASTSRPPGRCQDPPDTSRRVKAWSAHGNLEILSMEHLAFSLVSVFFLLFLLFFFVSAELAAICLMLSNSFPVVCAESRSTVSRRMRRARRTSSSVSTKIFM